MLQCRISNGWQWSHLFVVPSTGGSPHLLFANREDIRHIDLLSSEYRAVIEQTRTAIALDYDFVEKKVYWSDVAEETIYGWVFSTALRSASTLFGV